MSAPETQPAAPGPKADRLRPWWSSHEDPTEPVVANGTGQSQMPARDRTLAESFSALLDAEGQSAGSSGWFAHPPQVIRPHEDRGPDLAQELKSIKLELSQLVAGSLVVARRLAGMIEQLKSRISLNRERDPNGWLEHDLEKMSGCCDRITADRQSLLQAADASLNDMPRGPPARSDGPHSRRRAKALVQTALISLLNACADVSLVLEFCCLAHAISVALRQWQRDDPEFKWFMQELGDTDPCPSDEPRLSPRTKQLSFDALCLEPLKAFLNYKALTARLAGLGDQAELAELVQRFDDQAALMDHKFGEFTLLVGLQDTLAGLDRKLTDGQRRIVCCISGTESTLLIVLTDMALLVRVGEAGKEVEQLVELPPEEISAMASQAYSPLVDKFAESLGVDLDTATVNAWPPPRDVWPPRTAAKEHVEEYEDGSLYTGEWAGGMRHGHGVLAHKDGGTYTGQFVNDSYHGQGTFKYADNAVYDGQWREARKHGVGKYRYPDGSQYEGDFVADKYHGDGVYTYPDGLQYVGQWVDNSAVGMHGVLNGIPNGISSLRGTSWTALAELDHAGDINPLHGTSWTDLAELEDEQEMPRQCNCLWT